jgi:hypothetical protein
VHDRRSRPDAAVSRKQRDRLLAVRRDRELDLTRLLARVDVQDEPFAVGVPADLGEPVRRTRANGVGGDADADVAPPQLLDVV